MREITDLNELKKIELSVLIEVDKICRENGLRYMLCGGTLLGAVRHGGFIPWDDDIDIFMPRPDYDKLIDYCDEHDVSFDLFSPANNREYTQMYLKACNKDTMVIDNEADLKMCHFGVWVDIFPIDGLGDTVLEAKRFLRTITCAELLCVASRWKKYTRNPKNRWGYEVIRFCTFLISRMIFDVNAFVKKIDKKAKSLEFEKSKYCGSVYGSYGQKEIMTREMFEKTCELTFENQLFLCPENYEEYLKNIYGNYMELPPVEEQQTHHNFVAYWKE